MYEPKTYERLVVYATALRAILNGRGRSRTGYTVYRTAARFEALVEHAYLVGIEEGYREGENDTRNQIEADRETMGSGADFA
mgnify:CR=1 FL=1